MPNKFPPEVRERAVRMVHEHRREYPSLWAAMASTAPKIGCVPQTLLDWVKRQGVDAGMREVVTTKERSASRNANAKSRNCAVPTRLEVGERVFRRAELDRRFKV